MSVFTNVVDVENVVSVDGSAVIQPVSGTVAVSNFPATQPVSGTVAVTQSTSPWITTSTPVTSSTANVTQVTAVNATNITVIAANANRKKLILFFPKGNATSYLKFGATASATSYTYLIAANNTVLEITTWVGQVDFNGAAQTIAVTELV